MDAIRLEIESRRDDLIRLTQDLIRIPTLNPPGRHYRDICDYLQARLAPQGWDCRLVRATGTPGDCEEFPRWNIVASHDAGRPGECVHFNSHHDVVEIGHGWSRDPFGAELDGDRIYGRGACDMKGGLAASIVAAEAFVALYPDHPGRIEISATADEESGGFGGVAYLAERGWFSKPRVDHVIIPEPLNVDRVCIGHRGVWWAEIETKGRIAHGSMPFLGDSAIRHMGAVLDSFERELLPALAAKTTAMPVVPDGARQSTLNINSIHGGQVEPKQGRMPSPVVADSCRIVIDRRFMIEHEIVDVKAEVKATLDRLKHAREGFHYELRDLFEVIPSMTDRNAPVARATAAAIRNVLQREPAFICSPGSYDQKHIDRIGKLKDCVAYGPGILDLAHQPDEYVVIADLVRSSQVMALAALSLLTGRA